MLPIINLISEYAFITISENCVIKSRGDLSAINYDSIYFVHSLDKKMKVGIKIE